MGWDCGWDCGSGCGRGAAPRAGGAGLGAPSRRLGAGVDGCGDPASGLDPVIGAASVGRSAARRPTEGAACVDPGWVGSGDCGGAGTPERPALIRPLSRSSGPPARPAPPARPTPPARSASEDPTASADSTGSTGAGGTGCSVRRASGCTGGAGVTGGCSAPGWYQIDRGCSGSLCRGAAGLPGEGLGVDGCWFLGPVPYGAGSSSSSAPPLVPADSKSSTMSPWSHPSLDRSTPRVCEPSLTGLGVAEEGSRWRCRQEPLRSRSPSWRPHAMRS